MKLLKAAILLHILTLYGIFAKVRTDPEPFTSTTSTTAKPDPTTIPTTVAPSPSPSPTTTTTSTVSPTTSSTTTTTSTTTSPTTSTTSSSTTSSTTPSTTTSTPSTSVAPTTTGSPTTTAPPPKQKTWEVVYPSTNFSCILLKMAAEIEMKYVNSSNITQETSITVPINATATGSCGDAKNANQSIKLTWSFHAGYNESLEFLFSTKDKKFEMDSINLTLALDPWNFPNATDANKTFSFIHKNVEFVTPLAMSYKCDKKEDLKLYNSTNANVTVGTLTISDFQFQAFGNTSTKNFADVKDCEPYETPDVVPIAVGCALMALIIIVLIGYLIGRRRNQARGYLSM